MTLIVAVVFIINTSLLMGGAESETYDGRQFLIGKQRRVRVDKSGRMY